MTTNPDHVLKECEAIWQASQPPSPAVRIHNRIRKARGTAIAIAAAVPVGWFAASSGAPGPAVTALLAWLAGGVAMAVWHSCGCPTTYTMWCTTTAATGKWAKAAGRWISRSGPARAWRRFRAEARKAEKATAQKPAAQKPAGQ